MRVPWDNLSTEVFEDLGVALLNHLHPRIRRLDGRGGDGGRDAFFESETGLEVWQLKYFRGRLKGSQKTQIRRSLLRAAELDPAMWTLVLPMDLTPAEDDWFDGLRSLVNFPIQWRGESWLNLHLAERPPIVRYFVNDAKAEVIELLREIQQDSALIDSADEGAERFRSVAARLNDFDAYFNYEVTLGRSAPAPAPAGAILSRWTLGTRIDVFEGYPGALEDRPITISFTVEIGHDREQLAEAFRAALDYGQPVALPSSVLRDLVIDAPGGLGGTFEGGDLSISPAEIHAGIRSLQLQVVEAGRPIASVIMNVSNVTRGIRGGVLEFADPSGWLSGSLRFEAEMKRFSLNMSVHAEDALPSEVMPVIHWLRVFTPSRNLELGLPGGEPWASIAIPQTLCEPALSELFLMFDAIQRRVGFYFIVPLDVTKEEFAELQSTYELLEHGVHDFAWSEGHLTMTLRLGEPNLFEPMLRSPGAAMMMRREETWGFREHKVPLGLVQTEFDSALIVDPDAFRLAVEAGLEELPVTLKPGASPGARRRVSRADGAGDH